jgi:chemotaxis protein MotA
MRITFSTLLGLLLGVILVVLAIKTTTNNYAIFISLSSAFIVFGGTIAAVFISYHLRFILQMLREVSHIILTPKDGLHTPVEDIKTLVAWAGEVKKTGLATLENKIGSAKGKHEFTYYALTLMSSNYTSEELHSLFENFIESKYQRDNIAVDILLAMAGFAPAFGMIGTLIGLIVMLDGLGNDPGQLGAGLAVALNTTFYGVLLANLLFKPSAAKIKIRNQLSRDRYFLLAEGFVLLRNKAEPLLVQDRLNSFVDTKNQFDMFATK